MRAPVRVPALLLSLLLAACGSPTGNTITPDEESKDGEATCDPAVYPCGPYGYLPGAVLKNLALVGKRDLNANGSPVDDALQTPLKLSAYFAEKNIAVLVLLASAEWCTPCQEEQPELVTLYNRYQSSGGGVAMLEAMVQDNEGKPADDVVADRWATTYDLPFDIACDPGDQLGPYYDVKAFPMQMVIKTSDMTIVWQNNGLATAQLAAAIKQVVGR